MPWDCDADRPGTTSGLIGSQSQTARVDGLVPSVSGVMTHFLRFNSLGLRFRTEPLRYGGTGGPGAILRRVQELPATASVRYESWSV